MSRRQRPVLARASAALLILLAIEPRSAEPPPVDRLLETAATASGDAYLAARDAVVDGGTNALAELGRIATDSSGTWQKRLVARPSSPLPEDEGREPRSRGRVSEPGRGRA